MPMSGYEVWYDDFNGVAGTQPPQWNDRTQNPAFGSEIVYDDIYSYALITPTVDTLDKYKSVHSANIICNVSLYDTIEIKVPDTNNTAETQWSLALQELTGYANYYYLHKESGATGTFAFDLPHDLGWSGEKGFYIDAKVSSYTANYLKLDYVRIFQNVTNERVYWREDFIGPANALVKSWWSNNRDPVIDAEIYYDPLGTQGRITYLGPGEEKAKVISPGVYWNPAKHPLLSFQITNMPEGVNCNLSVIEIGGEWAEIVVGNAPQSGSYTIDVTKTPGWPWMSEKLLGVEFWIQADQVGKSYDLDYVKILALKTPSPTSTIDTTPPFPQGGYATPNPFLPATGQKAFFNFRFSDSAAAATIKIYNVRGRVVRTLKNPSRPEWDGRDEAGHLCEGGIYLYQIESGGQRVSGRVVLIK